MPGLIQKCPAWPASMRLELGQIRNARSDFPCPIQFHSCEEGRDHIVQSQPRSNLDGLVTLWPNGSGLEASWCAGIIGPASGGTQAACYQFPLSDSVVFFHRQPGSWLHKAGVCKSHWAHFWPMLLRWFRQDADQIQHVYCDIAKVGRQTKSRVWVGLMMAEILLFFSLFF